MKNSIADKRIRMSTASIFRGIFIFSLLIYFTVSSPVVAREVIGDGLLIAPTKIDLGNRFRSGVVTIKNQASKPTTYRLKMVGPLDSDPGGDASTWVRFSPRRVTLNPGETQTVRIFARRPSDLKKGKYTARLMVQAIPPVKPKSPEGGMQVDDDRVSLDLTIVYGVTIPILIGHKS